MRAENGAVCVDTCEDVAYAATEDDRCDLDSTDSPDLADPATLGCLLALVRVAWGDQTIHLRAYPSYDLGHFWRLTFVPSILPGEVVDPQWMPLGGRLWWGSEAEALVTALEYARVMVDGSGATA